MADSGWIKCSDRLPDEDGVYLVVHTFGEDIEGLPKRVVNFCDFTTKLCSIDSIPSFDPEKDNRPGWWEEEAGNDWSRYEVTTVTHWMPFSFPEPPED